MPSVAKIIQVGTVSEPTHDVAVTSLSAPASVTQGDFVDISVNVANEGTFDETFSVSLTDNLSADISNTPQDVVNLEAGSSMTLTFSWTPIEPGDHVLTATASTVADETDTADNSKAKIIKILAVSEPTHDVAVTSLSAPASAAQGVFVNISVNVANEGTFEETFSVSLTDSLSADISNSPQNVVNLTAGSSTTLTFSWTPTEPGDHVLTATASTVADETDTTDNSKSTISSVTAPSSSGITLTATGYMANRLKKADLEWSGATSTNVDVYRSGGYIGTVENNGFYTDHIAKKGGGTYTYQVCEEGTFTCSNEATVTF